MITGCGVPCGTNDALDCLVGISTPIRHAVADALIVRRFSGICLKWT